MNWISYKKDFIEKAKKNGKSDEYCDCHLKYAKKLVDNNVPIIYNTEHLSKLVGYDIELLYAISNDQIKFYRRYYIPKKDKTLREICEPLPTLKEIQKWILDNILNNQKSSGYSKAFRNGVSIKDNASYHIESNLILSLDIKDYFPSIKYNRVYNFYYGLGYTKSVAVLLSNLCLLNGSLPQGAPTSPALSNLVTKNIDKNISNFTNKRKIRYTRYADDMTFSGNFNAGEIISFVNHVLSINGFKLNRSKIRTRKQFQQQEVTGIVVNKKMQISKKKRKEIRQSFYYINKYGIDSHMERINVKNKKQYLQSFIGEIEFALFVNKDDKELNTIRDGLVKLYNDIS